jgi:hypothetical protein
MATDIEKPLLCKLGIHKYKPILGDFLWWAGSHAIEGYKCERCEKTRDLERLEWDGTDGY